MMVLKHASYIQYGCEKQTVVGGLPICSRQWFFILALMPFFNALNLAKNWTERSQLFDMTVNLITNPVNFQAQCQQFAQRSLNSVVITPC
jgi:hypothetical protein